MEQCGITIQSADPVALFTVVISGLFTSGAAFSLAYEYSMRNQNSLCVLFEQATLRFETAHTANCFPLHVVHVERKRSMLLHTKHRHVEINLLYELHTDQRSSDHRSKPASDRDKRRQCAVIQLVACQANCRLCESVSTVDTSPTRVSTLTLQWTH